MTTPSRLVTPPPLDPVRNAIDHCKLMIGESVEDILLIRAGGVAKHHPSHLGNDYDDAWAQGRKDACRVILLTLGVEGIGTTTDNVDERKEKR